MKRRNLRILMLSLVLILVLIFALLIDVIERKNSKSESLATPDLGAFFEYSEYDFLENFDRAEIKDKADCGDIVIRDFMLGDDEKKCLYFTPDADDEDGIGVIYRGLRMGGMSHLTFSLGIGPRDEAVEIAPDSGELTFQVFIIDKDDREKIFEEVLKSKNGDDPGRWFDFDVDLSKFSDKTVGIAFVTKRDHGDDTRFGAFLSRPLLHTLPYDEDWPNIIFISIDTLRSDHLGLSGYFRDTSPNIDAFAEGGVHYKRCISQAPFTLTSYASIFTGLYPNRTMACAKLDDGYITWAEILKELGYETVSYNGGCYVSNKLGVGQGFDLYQEYPNNAAFENDIVWEIEGAIKYLKEWNEKKKKKIFMFIHTYEVHSWYQPPDEYKKAFLRGDEYYSSRNNFLLKGDIKQYLGSDEWGKDGANRYKEIPFEHKEIFIDLYDAEIYYMDVWLGRFFDFLKEEGIYDDALIVLNSDHGEEFYEHGGWCHSHQLYGELINVPLIIKYPKGEIKGVEEERIARSIDILPTILHDVLGLDIKKFDFDGVPLSKSLGDAKTLSFNFYGFNLARIAIYRGDHKFIMNFSKYAGAEPERPKREVYRFLKDPNDKNRIEIGGTDEFEYFSYISKTEKALFDLNRNKMLERKSGLDLEPAVDEETVEKLKDLGYLQ